MVICGTTRLDVVSSKKMQKLKNFLNYWVRRVLSWFGWPRVRTRPLPRVTYCVTYRAVGMPIVRRISKDESII